MIKFSKVSEKFKNEHLSRCRELFDFIYNNKGHCANVLTGVANANDLTMFLRDNFNTIVVGEPDSLREVIREIELRFPDFYKYAYKRPRKTSTRYDEHFAKLCVLVEELFDYDLFSDRNGVNGAYALVIAHNKRLCPYCHINHINYHISQSKAGLTLRPALDHYYPRGKYPYLGVSLYNLVPACHQCNSSIKGALDPLVDNVPHPCEEQPKISIKFKCSSILPAIDVQSMDDFTLSIEGIDEGSQKFVELFKLVDRYSWHKPEVLDVYRKFQRYEDIDPEFKKVVRRTEFVLGFLTVDAPNRPLGHMLVDVALCL